MDNLGIIMRGPIGDRIHYSWAISTLLILYNNHVLNILIQIND